MAQLKKVVDPFGEVNVTPIGVGKVRVTATILMEPNREGTQTGIALDGSGSMSNLYGVRAGTVLSPIFGGRSPLENVVSPVAQKICAYLARRIDSDGGTTCIYWATGFQGAQVQVIGDLKADQAERYTFAPPSNFGSGTQLLPAVKYFVERFADAPWGFYVFITDGELHDLDAVKAYTRDLAQQISGGKRRPLKFVLIGVGAEVNEKQMEELDDLDTGTDIDLWDHKLASEMRVLEQIFAEVVDRNARVADRGRILDPHGKVVKDYSDTGVPAFLSFEMPASATYFTLEVTGHTIHQGLSDAAAVPVGTLIPQPAPPRTTPIPATVPNATPVPTTIPNATPVATEPKPAPKRDDDEWLGFDLKFEKDEPKP